LAGESIDIIVVNYKTYPLVQKFIDSYYKYLPSVESNLIIIDNEATLEGIRYLDPYDAKVVPLDDNVGYSGACNLGASLGDSKYIGFFNSDCEFNNNECIDKCIEYLEEHDDVAVVGPLQYSSDGRVTHGGIFGTHDNPQHRAFGNKTISLCRDNKEAVTVSGSAYITRRSVWDEMKDCSIYQDMFPEATGAWPPFPHFFEETLYSYHTYGHGYKCMYLGEAEMIHQWHKSSAIGSQDNNFKIGQKGFREFCDKHGIPCD